MRDLVHSKKNKILCSIKCTPKEGKRDQNMFKFSVMEIQKHFVLWGTHWLCLCPLLLPKILYSSLYITICNMDTDVYVATSDKEPLLWEIWQTKFCIASNYTAKFTQTRASSSAKLFKGKCFITNAMQLSVSTLCSLSFLFLPVISSNYKTTHRTRNIKPSPEAALSIRTPVQSRNSLFSAIILSRVLGYGTAQRGCNQYGLFWSWAWKANKFFNSVCTKYWRALSPGIPEHFNTNTSLFQVASGS